MAIFFVFFPVFFHNITLFGFLFFSFLLASRFLFLECTFSKVVHCFPAVSDGIFLTLE